MSPALPRSPARRALSPALAHELSRQQRRLAPSAARDAHLRALGDADLGVVVTGQQVGLFLGPAYSLYKAATAVALARRLAERSGRPTVPLFWLQTEDHDADEVASCGVLDGDGALAQVTLAPGGAARASMAERSLGDGVHPALAELAAALGDAPHAGEALALLTRHYRPEARWAEAFAGVLGEVFAAEGLLVFDPRVPAVAELARPVHRRALLEASALDEALARGAALLGDAGEPVAVKPRPGCSLTFHHPEGPGGPRHRLVRAGEGWLVPGRSEPLPTADLLERLEREPLTFSTSSLLRVILQDTLLPAVAQVAGPGEARYLRQMPPLHAAFGLDSPPVVERGRFVVTDHAVRRSLAALGVDATGVRDRESLLQALAHRDEGPSGEDVATRLKAAFARELDALGPALLAIDPSLEGAVGRTRAHVARGVDKLGARVEAARARHDTTRVARADALCRRLWPAGAPQERALSFPSLAARFGATALIDAVLAALPAHLDAIEAGEPARLREVAL